MRRGQKLGLEWRSENSIEQVPHIGIICGFITEMEEVGGCALGVTETK